MASSDECYLLLVEAINENSEDKIYRAKDLYSAFELFTSLVQCNKEGETLLATAMKRKNVSIIHELVISVLKECDFTLEENQLKLFTALNQLSRQIPTTDILGYLLNDSLDLRCITDPNWFKFIAQVFIMSTSFTRQDKIIALELTGASLIASYYDESFSKFLERSILALHCWRQAMTLRYFPTNGDSLLPKAHAVRVQSVSYATVFGSAVEFTTMEELDLLQEDLERCSSLFTNAALPCVKRMLIQSLLVTRRIFIQANPGHLCWPYLKNFFVLADLVPLQFPHIIQENKLIINIYLHILELMNGFDTKMLSCQSFRVIVKALGELSVHFDDAILKSSNGPANEELTYHNLLVPTESIAMIIKFVHDPETVRSGNEYESPWDDVCLSKIIYVLLMVLNSISPKITKEEKQKLEVYYAKFIRNFFPEYPSSILHCAIEYHVENSSQSSLETIKLMIQLGADVNAIDYFGRTPLYILAKTHENHSQNYLLAFQTLVDAGTHLDTTAMNGQTVISALKENLMRYKKRGEIVDPYFESLLNDVFPLTCYCARVIRRHRIPFEDRLPPRLQAFVLPRTAQR